MQRNQACCSEGLGRHSLTSSLQLLHAYYSCATLGPDEEVCTRLKATLFKAHTNLKPLITAVASRTGMTKL